MVVVYNWNCYATRLCGPPRIRMSFHPLLMWLLMGVGLAGLGLVGVAGREGRVMRVLGALLLRQVPCVHSVRGGRPGVVAGWDGRRRSGAGPDC